MPFVPLLSLSKEEIAERLIEKIKAGDAAIEELAAALAGLEYAVNPPEYLDRQADKIKIACEVARRVLRKHQPKGGA